MEPTPAPPPPRAVIGLEWDAASRRQRHTRCNRPSAAARPPLTGAAHTRVLGCVTALGGLDVLGDGLRSGAEREEGPYQEVDRDGGIAGLHLGDARLARLELLR